MKNNNYKRCKIEEEIPEEDFDHEDHLKVEEDGKYRYINVIHEKVEKFYKTIGDDYEIEMMERWRAFR